MPAIQMTTFRDLTEHLIDYLGSNVTQESLRDCRMAVLSAYRDMTNDAAWSYFYQRGRLVTNAPQNTGTIQYTHTGGAFERMMVLSGASWPSWVRYGQIVITSGTTPALTTVPNYANIVFQVADQKDAQTITLSINSNPGQNIPAGTTYLLFRDSYPMPCDFLAADEMINTNHFLRLWYEHPRVWLSRQRIIHTPAAPRIYTFKGSASFANVLAVHFFPPPDQMYQMDFLYKRQGRPLVIDQYATGTVSAVAGSSTLTGSGTAWTSSMVGSVIRLSADGTNLPTPAWGANTAAYERLIASFTSATSVTLDSAIPATVNGVKYSISDPVDIEPGAMLTCLLRCCEKQSTVVRIMKNGRDAFAAYKEALLLAREADARNMARRAPGAHTDFYRLRDFPRAPDVS